MIVASQLRHGGGHGGGGGFDGGGGFHGGGGRARGGGARRRSAPAGARSSSSGRRARGVVIGRARRASRHGGSGWGYGGGGWNGYLVHGGLRRYYGLGVGYWGGPWFYPPYYGDWVFFWGPAYYPARPSMEVLESGLPEGVLPPGARVSGFLYFKRATGAHQGALDLSWDVHDARSGASLGSLHVPLEVVHR